MNSLFLLIGLCPLALLIGLCSLAPRFANRESQTPYAEAVDTEGEYAEESHNQRQKRQGYANSLAQLVKEEQPKDDPVSTNAGNASCPCIMNGRPKVDCNSVVAVDGKCVETNGAGVGNAYNEKVGGWFSAVDFGEECKVHQHPGWEECSDPATGLPWERSCDDAQVQPKSFCRQAFCDLHWCYIDPSNCDMDDIRGPSQWVPDMYFSYATCGQNDLRSARPKSTLSANKGEESISSRATLLTVSFFVAVAWAL